MMKMEKSLNDSKTIPNGVANGIIGNGINMATEDPDAMARRAEGVASLKQKLVTVVEMIKSAQARFEVCHHSQDFCEKEEY